VVKSEILQFLDRQKRRINMRDKPPCSTKISSALALNAVTGSTNIDHASDADTLLLKLEIRQLLDQLPMRVLLAIDQELEERLTAEEKRPRPRG
jgi:hypothetical protein